MEQIEKKEAEAMEFSSQAVVYLNETRKWTIFLSILGFIFLGLLVLVALFMSTLFSTLTGNAMPFPGMGIAMGVGYLLVGLVYFFPIYYLYQFSVHSKKAIYNQSSEELDLAFKFLKSHYKFMGILTIVILSIYLLAFIIAGVVGGISSMM